MENISNQVNWLLGICAIRVGFRKIEEHRQLNADYFGSDLACQLHHLQWVFYPVQNSVAGWMLLPGVVMSLRERQMMHPAHLHARLRRQLASGNRDDGLS